MSQKYSRLDVGDGLVDLRRANASLSNVTLTDEELRGLVSGYIIALESSLF